MWINKHYYMEKCLMNNSDRVEFFKDGLSTEQYELTNEAAGKFAVIHYPDDREFTPIALGEKYVCSGEVWSIRKFYHNLCAALELKDGHSKTRGLTYGVSREGNTVNWGCRNFSRTQLRLIKRTMEAEYTEQQLKGRK